jgi:hypothetical protein
MVPMLQFQTPLADDSRLLGSYVMLFWYVPTFRRKLLSSEFYLKDSEVAEWKKTCRLYTKIGRKFSVVTLNPLKTKRRMLYLKTQSVPRCKHFSSLL